MAALLALAAVAFAGGAEEGTQATAEAAPEAMAADAGMTFDHEWDSLRTFVTIVLSLPTVGPLLLEALVNEDIILAGSVVMILSFLTVLGTLLSDLLLVVLDPRIRFEGGSR